MAGLTSPPGYGTNSWNEEKWSRGNFVMGARFLVGGPTHWRPTISTTADRTITINAGWGMCCGVYDETTTETIQFAANTGGSVRNDVLVARFDWNLNTRVFAIIQGGLNPPPVNQSTTAVDAATINRIPGLRYDAVIAMVTVRPNVGTFAAGDMADIRVWDSGSQLVTNFDHGFGRNAVYSLSSVDPGGTIMSLDSGRVWRNVGGGQWKYAGGNPPNVDACGATGGWHIRPFYEPGVFMDASGLVRLVGAVTPDTNYNAVDGADHTFLQLPSSIYYPADEHYFIIPQPINALLIGRVTPDGRVGVVGGRTVPNTDIINAGTIHTLDNAVWHPKWTGGAYNGF